MKKNFLIIICLIVCSGYIIMQNQTISMQSQTISAQSQRINNMQSEQDNLRQSLSSLEEKVNLLQSNIDNLQKQESQLLAEPVEDMFRASIKSEDDYHNLYYYDVDEKMSESYTSPILMDGYCNHSLWVYGILIRSIRICSLTDNGLEVVASPPINSSYMIRYSEDYGYYYINLYKFESYFNTGIVIEITSFNNRKYYISCHNKEVGES